jgi:hypothetical protein
MKSPSFDYSFKVNDCNRSYVKKFVEEYERKKRKMRIPASRNSNNILLREGEKTINLNPRSTLGKYLKTVPSKILKLSIIESKRCSK